eukprot:9486623-Pyramimonas_sp.AAC.1
MSIARKCFHPSGTAAIGPRAPGRAWTLAPGSCPSNGYVNVRLQIDVVQMMPTIRHRRGHAVNSV